MFLLLIFALLSVCLNAQSNTTCKSANTVCPNNGLCNPNTMRCVDSKQTIACGNHGDFLTCGPEGVVWGECGSGSKDDCLGTVCPDKSQAIEGIDCNYPGLEPSNSAFNATKWLCGDEGQKLSCFDIEGSVLVGVCGSGSSASCKEYCTGFHGILCARQEYFGISWQHGCSWVAAAYGDWVYCPIGTVGTGHCGSGKHADCGHKDWHSLQCCQLEYN